MMYSFPFYPQFATKSYRGYPHNVTKNAKYNAKKSTETGSLRKSYHENYDLKINKSPNMNSSNNNRTEKIDNEKQFEILGIKLYSDDILLLCLIFFLYKEGVQDEYLFVSLLMLLLS